MGLELDIVGAVIAGLLAPFALRELIRGKGER